jgi:bacterioferritin
MDYREWRTTLKKTAEEDTAVETDEQQDNEAEAKTDDTATEGSHNNVIDMLRKILADEIVSYYAYFAGAKNIRGENWMDVKQEFEQHAGDELGHFEAVFDRLYKLGYNCQDMLSAVKDNAGYYWDVDTIEPKKAAEIAHEAEKKAVEAYEKLLAYIAKQDPDKRDYATEKLAKDHLETEQDHLQDMERLVEEF